MAYLGTPPQSGFITTAKQRVTSSTNAYVDLDHAISSIADVIVFVNFVKQDTTNLTLTTSTRITLGGTLVSSDIVEIHYLGKAVNTQTPATGTVTNDMLAGSIANDKLAGSIANDKLANSSISINGSSVSLGGSITGIGEANSPYWFGRKTNLSDQYLTRATKTKVTSMTDDEADSHSAYSSNRFTVPSGHGGIYLVTGSIHGVSSNAGGDGEEFNVYVYKNGTEKRTSGFSFDPGGKFNQIYLNLVGLIELAEGDYVELYAELSDDDNSNTMHINGGVGTHFGGFKIA